MCFVTQMSCLYKWGGVCLGGLRGQLTDDIGIKALSLFRHVSDTVTHTIVLQEKFNNFQYHMTNFLN